MPISGCCSGLTMNFTSIINSGKEFLKGFVKSTFPNDGNQSNYVIITKCRFKVSTYMAIYGQIWKASRAGQSWNNQIYRWNDYIYNPYNGDRFYPIKHSSYKPEVKML